MCDVSKIFVIVITFIIVGFSVSLFFPSYGVGDCVAYKLSQNEFEKVRTGIVLRIEKVGYYSYYTRSIVADYVTEIIDFENDLIKYIKVKCNKE